MYLLIKTIHIISATLLFGTGLGSAFFMYLSYRSENISAMAVTNRIVVIADFVFTTPAVFIQLASGLYLLQQTHLAWNSTWALLVFALFAFVGACWLPVVWLQIRLRDRAAELDCIDNKYRRQMRIWLILGLLAFPAVLLLYGLMIFKPFWS